MLLLNYYFVIIELLFVFRSRFSRVDNKPGEGHSIVKNTGAGSIVWGLGFWLEKIFWGSSKILIWTIVRG